MKEFVLHREHTVSAFQAQLFSGIFAFLFTRNPQIHSVGQTQSRFNVKWGALSGSNTEIYVAYVRSSQDPKKLQVMVVCEHTLCINENRGNHNNTSGSLQQPTVYSLHSTTV